MYWCEQKGIHVLAAISALVLGVMVFLSYLPTKAPSPGDEVSNPLPWVADLCLAYLGAYVFHALVVALPAKRKMQSRFITLMVPLATIGLAGRNLIRDLEYIAHCPPRRIDHEHVTKVLTALNDNPAVKELVAEHLSRARDAYSIILPYAADLPLELQELLQIESQDPIHKKFMKFTRQHEGVYVEYAPKFYRSENDEFDQGKRKTLAPYSRLFLSYYELTEEAYELIKPNLPENSSISYRGSWLGHTPHHTWRYYGMRKNLNVDYPPEATNKSLEDYDRRYL